MTYQELQKLDFDYKKSVQKYDKNLPVFNSKSWIVPRKYSHGLPKNLREYTLDNFECYMPISKILYNIGVIEKRTKFSQFIIDPYKFVSVDNDGPDLFDIGNGYADTAGFNNLAVICKMELGTIGKLYDRLAIETGGIGGNGNVRLGVYDTATGGKPTNLDAETGSFAHVINDFSWHSITEYSLSTTQNWVALNFSHNLDQAKFDSTSPASSRWHKIRTFGVFENPFTGGTLNENIEHVKMGHS